MRRHVELRKSPNGNYERKNGADPREKGTGDGPGGVSFIHIRNISCKRVSKMVVVTPFGEYSIGGH